MSCMKVHKAIHLETGVHWTRVDHSKRRRQVQSNTQYLEDTVPTWSWRGQESRGANEVAREPTGPPPPTGRHSSNRCNGRKLIYPSPVIAGPRRHTQALCPPRRNTRLRFALFGQFITDENVRNTLTKWTDRRVDVWFVLSIILSLLFSESLAPRARLGPGSGGSRRGRARRP